MAFPKQFKSIGFLTSVNLLCFKNPEKNPLKAEQARTVSQNSVFKSSIGNHKNLIL